MLVAKSKQSCENLLSRLISLCNYLGVPIAPEKTVGPETELPFVGITLDSIRMEARLAEEKLEKCRTMLLDFYKRRKVTLRELHSLIGLLNFTCSVVLPGRAFLRRLIDLTRGIRRPHFKICLNIVSRGDWLGNSANFKEACLCLRILTSRDIDPAHNISRWRSVWKFM